MYIAKTSRRKGFHKLTLPKGKKPGLIKAPKMPKLKKSKVGTFYGAG